MVEISLEDIVDALKENKEVFETFLKNLEGKDVKLGKNREKMEQQLKETQKDKAKSKKEDVKKTSKKAVVEEDEDDEDEEAPAPKKSSKKVEEKKK